MTFQIVRTLSDPEKTKTLLGPPRSGLDIFFLRGLLERNPRGEEGSRSGRDRKEVRGVRTGSSEGDGGRRWPWRRYGSNWTCWWGPTEMAMSGRWIASITTETFAASSSSDSALTNSSNWLCVQHPSCLSVARVHFFLFCLSDVVGFC